MANSVWNPGNLTTPVYPSLALPNGAASIGGGDQVVTNFAGIRALLKTSASQYACALGAVNPNDGGGGNYYLVLSDTTSAESLPNIIVAADGGRWYLAPYTATSLLTQVPADNIVINGDMRVAQLGTTYALTNGLAYSNLDQWIAYQATTASGVCNQVAAPAGSGFQYMMKLGRNSGSVNVGTINAYQAMESSNCIPLAGQKVTVSFYAQAGANYSNVGNGIILSLIGGTGIDQAASNPGGWSGLTGIINTLFTLTTTLTRYSYTVTIPNNISQLGLQLYYTPVGIAGADDNVYITGVRIDPGSVPLTNRVVPYGDVLRQCQRFVQQFAGEYAGASPAVNFIGIRIPLAVAMRTTPTVTNYATGNGSGYCYCYVSNSIVLNIGLLANVSVAITNPLTSPGSVELSIAYTGAQAYAPSGASIAGTLFARL